eukprot:CAMPEP_0116127654 /NCGR_PEP_ID=MMETSP0329-20121206/6951_1 /TAXON_ID=697910 /ORGANISM="Pseudo-nitzschia arenysensis, Strain B593" /LENGTH=462 /DNA_ID=CAMNT_0003621759 /DNA_START=265 /DNA_END=1653 /DNA_ORIENTATION=-
MFSLFNGIYDSYLAPTQLNLLVVGAPESGKTTLLERLKVTEIPSRPRKKNTNTAQQQIADDEPPETLKKAILETGATMGRSRHRSLSRSSLASAASSKSGTSRRSAQPTPTPTPTSPAQKPAPANENGNGNPVVVKKRRNRFALFCPAPERYAKASQDQDEVYVEEEPTNSEIFREDSFSSQTPQRVRCHSKEMDVDNLDLSLNDGTDDSIVAEMKSHETIPKPEANQRETSMQSIGLDDEEPPISSKAPLHQQQEATGPSLLYASTKEYNVKANAKMLPLRMIRPTIGTNLAKIDMYGAKCHIFDVGGKLQDLWERYYDDCDAVIFCWKLGEDPDKIPEEPDSDDDSDQEEETIDERIYKKQQELLDTVRKSIPDDVPFLILGHVFGNANPDIVDQMYNTDLLMPRYHNPMTGFCCSSAKTGAGVQSALEWLIPLAKRQQRERIATKRELDMMLEEQGKTV